MWLYMNPTIAPAISQPPCTPASKKVLDCRKAPSGVSSWIRAVMVGQNIQNPAETRVFIR